MFPDINLVTYYTVGTDIAGQMLRSRYQQSPDRGILSLAPVHFLPDQGNRRFMSPSSAFLQVPRGRPQIRSADLTRKGAESIMWFVNTSVLRRGLGGGFSSEVS